MILHIASRKDWKAAGSVGAYTAPSLHEEGFIHCSTVKQAVDTANVFFKGQTGLALLCIDESKLTAELKYEAPTGGGAHDPSVGKLFPHVYGPINLDAVTKVLDFPPNRDGSFTLPREAESLGSDATPELPAANHYPGDGE
jgi:uncharacterized protein (DUF952 family)